MAKLTVLYGHPTDSASFEEYYADNYLPLVEKIPNLRQFEAGRLSLHRMEASHPTTGSRSCGSRAWSNCRAAWVRQKDRQRRRTFRTSLRVERRFSSLRLSLRLASFREELFSRRLGE